jgi:hypothetical protein
VSRQRLAVRFRLRRSLLTGAREERPPSGELGKYREQSCAGAEGNTLIAEPHHSVFCSSPHSLHVYATRTCPGAAKTRFGVPHFPHMASIRVLPCFTATVFRSIASFTRRSVSSRIDCFDISRFLPLLPPRSYRNQRHFSAEQVEKRRRVDSTSTSS